MNLKFNPGFQETYCLHLRVQRVSQERNQHEAGSNYWLLISWSSSKKLTLLWYMFSFNLPLCKAVTLATLYQCALYFLPTDYEQSKYVSSSSGLFLIKYQCNEFYLQSLYFTTVWIVFVCISRTTNHTKKYDLYRPPGIVRKVKSRKLWCNKIRKTRIS
jgi:hypothetical protein